MTDNFTPTLKAALKAQEEPTSNWSKEEAELALLDIILSVSVMHSRNEADILKHLSVRTALDRLAALKAQEWQPIEMAPRDGRKIIAGILCDGKIVECGCLSFDGAADWLDHGFQYVTVAPEPTHYCDCLTAPVMEELTTINAISVGVDDRPKSLDIAARNLLNACLKADANEDLCELIDGSLLDDVSNALERLPTPPEAT